MTKSVTAAPGRNQSCPCGSGKKYKQCCGARSAAAAAAVPISVAPAKPGNRGLWFTLAGVGLIAVVGVVVARRGLTQAGTESVILSTEGGQTPAPWYYDAIFDRHWDPDHQHWHSGPPPAASAVPVATGSGDTIAATPPAWYYDSANNRHWDPGHAHWHDGPPPAEADRK